MEFLYDYDTHSNRFAHHGIFSHGIRSAQTDRNRHTTQIAWKVRHTRTAPVGSERVKTIVGASETGAVVGNRGN